MSISAVSHSCQHLVSSAIFRLATSVRVYKYMIVASVCTSLIICEVEYLVVCAGPLYIIFLSYTCSSPFSKFYSFAYLLKIVFKGSLYILDINILSNISLQTFFSLWPPLYSLNGVFGWTAALNFNLMQFATLFSVWLVLVCIVREIFACPKIMTHIFFWKQCSFTFSHSGL